MKNCSETITIALRAPETLWIMDLAHKLVSDAAARHSLTILGAKAASRHASAFANLAAEPRSSKLRSSESAQFRNFAMRKVRK